MPGEAGEESWIQGWYNCWLWGAAAAQLDLGRQGLTHAWARRWGCGSVARAREGGYQGQKGTEMVHKPLSPSVGLGSVGLQAALGLKPWGGGFSWSDAAAPSP